MKKSQDIEYTGTLPVTLTAIDSYLDSYEITGNMEQASTPTQTNPVIPQECGELVASGEHAGEYAIPITSDNVTTNIYLSEPLRKIGNYADQIDSNGTVTRYIHKKVFDGTETFAAVGTGDSRYFRCTITEPDVASSTNTSICTHFQYAVLTTSTTTVGMRAFVASGGIGSAIGIRPENPSSYTASTFAAWLASEYANGTPVIVWYALVTPVTETITAPQIPVSGETTIDYDGTLAPSQFELSVYGWVDMPYQMRSNNQWVDREEKKREDGEWV